MSNIIRPEDFRNMTPGQRRDVMKSLKLSNQYFVDRYNERFSPYYTTSIQSVSQALNNKNALLLKFICDEVAAASENRNSEAA